MSIKSLPFWDIVRVSTHVYLFRAYKIALFSRYCTIILSFSWVWNCVGFSWTNTRYIIQVKHVFICVDMLICLWADPRNLQKKCPLEICIYERIKKSQEKVYVILYSVVELTPERRMRDEIYRNHFAVTLQTHKKSSEKVYHVTHCKVFWINTYTCTYKTYVSSGYRLSIRLW